MTDDPGRSLTFMAWANLFAAGHTFQTIAERQGTDAATVEQAVARYIAAREDEEVTRRAQLRVERRERVLRRRRFGSLLAKETP